MYHNGTTKRAWTSELITRTELTSDVTKGSEGLTRRRGIQNKGDVMFRRTEHNFVQEDGFDLGQNHI